MQGDGHHSKLPPDGPDIRPGGPSWSGREPLEAMLRRIVEEAVVKAVHEAMKPEMVTVAYIMHHYAIKDPRTVLARCKKREIPLRNMHGQIKTKNDREVLISRSEWEWAERLHTKSVVNRVGRAK